MSPLQIDFEKKLTELGLSYSVHLDAYYTISSRTYSINPTVARLIQSLPVNNRVHVSKNGNQIAAIGLFKNTFLTSGFESDIFVFAFQNPDKNQAEFLIVPTLEFWRRHVEMNSKSVRRKGVEMVFWLMEDGFVFDATNISVEAEWYFMSKGVCGRMATGSELDYTEYLNGWRRLIV